MKQLKKEFDFCKMPKEMYIKLVKLAFDGFLVEAEVEAEEEDFKKSDWEKLFAKYPIEDWLDSDEEKAYFESLPDKLTVYRVEDRGIVYWSTDYWHACVITEEEGFNLEYKEIMKKDILYAKVDDLYCEVLILL